MRLKRLAIYAALALATALCAPAGAAENRGWPESGEMPLSFEFAKKKLGAKAYLEGWRHLHTIEIDRNRVIESWIRGDDEMTLMIWRIDAGTTGWSRGYSRAKGGTP